MTINPFASAVQDQAREAAALGVTPGNRRTTDNVRAESHRLILAHAWGREADEHAARLDDPTADAMRAESARLRERAKKVRAAMPERVEGDAPVEDGDVVRLNSDDPASRWARLETLALLIEERAAFLSMHAGAWHRPVLASEVGDSGRFTRHVRSTYRHLASTPDFQGHHTREAGAYRAPGIRSDLGLLGYASEDILGDAIEWALVHARRDAEAVEAGTASALARAEHAARLAIPAHVGGVPTLPILRGSLYRAIRAVYTRGMGAAGAMLRGKVASVQLDGTLLTVPSETTEYAAARAATYRDMVAGVARRERAGDAVLTVEARAYGEDAESLRERYAATGDPALLLLLSEAEEHDNTPRWAREHGQARVRDLAALVEAWPVTHDPAMVTVATLLVEGQTIEEIKSAYAEHYGKELSDATLTRWARQLGALAA